MKASALKVEEYHSYYQTYIGKLNQEETLLELLIRQSNDFPTFIANIPDNKLHYTYAEGKWSMAEVLQHIIDAERVFQYRALRFARKDTTPLPGFDQDVFANGVAMNNSTKASILEEYNTVRASSIVLFRSFDATVLKQVGTASDAIMSVAAAGFLIGAHQQHHHNILIERYL